MENRQNNFNQPQEEQLSSEQLLAFAEEKLAELGQVKDKDADVLNAIGKLELICLYQDPGSFMVDGGFLSKREKEIFSQELYKQVTELINIIHHKSGETKKLDLKNRSNDLARIAQIIRDFNENNDHITAGKVETILDRMKRYQADFGGVSQQIIDKLEQLHRLLNPKAYKSDGAYLSDPEKKRFIQGLLGDLTEELDKNSDLNSFTLEKEISKQTADVLNNNESQTDGLILKAAISNIEQGILREKLREHHHAAVTQELNAMSMFNPMRIVRYYNKYNLIRQRVDRDINAIFEHNRIPFFLADVFVDNDGNPIIENLDDYLTDATDRHHVETENKAFQSPAQVIEQIEANESITGIVRQYIMGEITEQQARILLNHEFREDAMQEILQGLNFTQIGTNILSKAAQVRAEYALLTTASEMMAEFSQHPEWDSELFMQRIDELVNNHIANAQQLPEFHKAWEHAKQSGNPEALQKAVSHHKGVMKAKIKLMTMSIDLITDGQSAYQINNEEDRQRFINRFCAFMDRHPILSGIGTVAVAGGSVALGGTLGLAAAGIGGSALILGSKAGAKKYGHYTGEHTHHEQERVENALQTEERIRRREEVVAGTQGGMMGDFRRYQARRNIELYRDATHADFADTRALADNISEAVTTHTQPGGMERLSNAILPALVRLDAYGAMGHNFLASQEKQTIEKDMADLKKSIDTGSKLGISLQALRSTEEYQLLFRQLEAEYRDAEKRFRRERRNLGWKYAGIGASVAAGFKFIGDYVVGLLEPDIVTTEAIYKTTLNEGVQLDEAIADTLSDAGMNNAQLATLQELITQEGDPSLFWDALDQILGEGKANEVKNSVMQTFWEVTNDGYNDLVGPSQFEIVNHAIDYGLELNDLQTPVFDRQVTFLINHGIMDADQTDALREAVTELLTNDTVPQDDEMKTILAEYMFLHIGKEAGIDVAQTSLYDVTMEQFSEWSTTLIKEGSEEEVSGLRKWLNGGPAIPTFFNTYQFLPREEQVVEEENQDGGIPDGDNSGSDQDGDGPDGNNDGGDNGDSTDGKDPKGPNTGGNIIDIPPKPPKSGQNIKVETTQKQQKETSSKPSKSPDERAKLDASKPEETLYKRHADDLLDKQIQENDVKRMIAFFLKLSDDKLRERKKKLLGRFKSDAASEGAKRTNQLVASRISILDDILAMREMNSRKSNNQANKQVQRKSGKRQSVQNN